MYKEHKYLLKKRSEVIMKYREERKFPLTQGEPRIENKMAPPSK